ncbi:MAG: hypothetical protein M1355_00675 [Patescibacteria group bacterium]|nr:hypothetical protein [Patescibacteria group bacterium]
MIIYLLFSLALIIQVAIAYFLYKGFAKLLKKINLWLAAIIYFFCFFFFLFIPVWLISIFSLNGLYGASVNLDRLDEIVNVVSTGFILTRVLMVTAIIFTMAAILLFIKSRIKYSRK